MHQERETGTYREKCEKETCESGRPLVVKENAPTVVLLYTLNPAIGHVLELIGAGINGEPQEPQIAVLVPTPAGDLNMDAHAQAMRSSFHEHVATRKKVTAAHDVENDDESWWHQEEYATEMPVDCSSSTIRRTPAAAK